MANNYEVVTFLQDLPASAISAAQVSMLEAFGFRFEPHIDKGMSTFYLYTDMECGINDMPLDALENMSEEDQETARALWSSHPIGQRLLDEDAGNRPDWTEIVQDILKGLDEATYPFIDVQAGYWCDKERPGEFGGWSMRIWRDTTGMIHVQDIQNMHRPSHTQESNEAWLAKYLQWSIENDGWNSPDDTEHLSAVMARYGLMAPEDFVNEMRERVKSSLDDARRACLELGIEYTGPGLTDNASPEQMFEAVRWLMNSDSAQQDESLHE